MIKLPFLLYICSTVLKPFRISEAATGYAHSCQVYRVCHLYGSCSSRGSGSRKHTVRHCCCCCTVDPNQGQAVNASATLIWPVAPTVRVCVCVRCQTFINLPILSLKLFLWQIRFGVFISPPKAAHMQLL